MTNKKLNRTIMLIRITKKNAAYVTFFLFIFLAIASCSKKDNLIEQITLPPTQILENTKKYAVIKSSHLRLRQEPSVNAAAITTLWKGYILEIVSKSGKTEVVEESTDYWYQISFNGLRGWIFGAYIELAPNIETAREISAKL